MITVTSWVRTVNTRDVKSSDRPRGRKNWPRWQWPRPRDTMASASCHLASWSRLLQCTYFMLVFLKC